MKQVCPQCKEEFIPKSHAPQRCCSNRCATKNYYLIHGISDERRKHLSDSHKGKVGYWTGKKRGAQTAIWIQKRVKKLIGQKRSNEFKDRMRLKHRGEKAYNWKGGRKMIGGYWWILSHDHPFKQKRGYVAEHRLVMEKHIGRYLDKNELIHHRNGIKSDNRIENLEIVIREMHFGSVRCPHCLKDFKVK